MPKFFFNVHDGDFVPDLLGTDLAGAAEARASPVELAGELLRDAAREGNPAARWLVTVTDEWGIQLFTVNVSVLDEGGRSSGRVIPAAIRAGPDPVRPATDCTLSDNPFSGGRVHDELSG